MAGKQKPRAIADKDISVEQLQHCVVAVIKAIGHRDIDDYLLAAGDQTSWNPTAKPIAAKCHRVVDCFVDVCPNGVIPTTKIGGRFDRGAREKGNFLRPEKVDCRAGFLHRW